MIGGSKDAIHPTSSEKTAKNGGYGGDCSCVVMVCGNEGGAEKRHVLGARLCLNHGWLGWLRITREMIRGFYALFMKSAIQNLECSGALRFAFSPTR